MNNQTPEIIKLPFFKKGTSVLTDPSLFEGGHPPALDTVSSILPRRILKNRLLRHLAYLERPEDFIGYRVPDSSELLDALAELKKSGTKRLEILPDRYHELILVTVKALFQHLGCKASESGGKIIIPVE